MNKNIAFIVIGLVVLVGIVGSIILTLERPDASATFISQVVILLGLLTTAAGTIYGLGKVAEKVEEVRHQTNGTLTKRDEKIEALEAELAEYRTRGQRRMERAAHRAEDAA